MFALSSGADYVKSVGWRDFVGRRPCDLARARSSRGGWGAAGVWCDVPYIRLLCCPFFSPKDRRRTYNRCEFARLNRCKEVT